MRQLQPALPSNADLDAAGNNGITLTNEQHKILTSQEEGSTTLYRVCEHRQQVEGAEPYLGITDEERGALTTASNVLQFRARLKGTNAGPGQARITDLLQPGDPPILQAFAHELENWPEINQFLEETFRER